MKDLLKALVVIITIVLPIVLFVKSKEVKELSFKNVAITELVSEKDITDKSIKVFFDEKRVFNLYSISCILSNSGNTPITKDDYTNEFEIQFPDSLEILKHSMKGNPTSIFIDNYSTKSEFRILPDLLNPNESIEFTFYVSKASSKLLPFSKSRIIGGEVLSLDMDENIKPKSEFSNRAFADLKGVLFWISISYMMLYIILAIWAVFFQKDMPNEGSFINILVFVIISFGMFCNVFYLIQTRF